VGQFQPDWHYEDGGTEDRRPKSFPSAGVEELRFRPHDTFDSSAQPAESIISREYPPHGQKELDRDLREVSARRAGSSHMYAQSRTGVTVSSTVHSTRRDPGGGRCQQAATPISSLLWQRHNPFIDACSKSRRQHHL
jgi:hypothetical protein